MKVELFETGAITSIIVNKMNFLNEDNDDDYPYYKSINKSLFNNYQFMQDITDPFIKRSYENFEWFYFVCKPYNKQYEKHQTWYESNQFITSVLWTIRKYVVKHGYGAPDMFLTKETNSKKHHINVLVCAPINLAIHYHNRNTNKYKIHCEKLDTIGDRTNVRDYMIKESKDRIFKVNKDYQLHYYGQVIEPYVE